MNRNFGREITTDVSVNKLSEDISPMQFKTKFCRGIFQGNFPGEICTEISADQFSKEIPPVEFTPKFLPRNFLKKFSQWNLNWNFRREIIEIIVPTEIVERNDHRSIFEGFSR